MIWLTWRQFRAQAVTAVAALAAFALLLAVKLALTGAAAMAVTEALSLLLAWWAAPINRATGLGGSVSVFSGSRFSPLVFATGGIAPLGYAAFGFALGVTAGLLIRRAVPAMALTLAIFAAVQVVMPLWVRPHLLPPDQTIAAIASTNATFSNVGAGPTLTASVVPGQPGAWIISSGAVNAVGQPVTRLPAACRQTAGPPAAGASSAAGFPSGIGRCLASHGVREAVSYQPASRYWPLQLTETGLFVALALALAWFCFWRLSRRLA
jgi:hypothetical protein